MRPGGGAGPDGMRPIYLQQMISPDTAEQGRRLLSALTSLINLALKGAIPDFARNAFYGASLIALNKKTGGIRPIAIGSIYRRLASKICARFAIGQLASQLEPTQLGVGLWVLRQPFTLPESLATHQIMPTFIKKTSLPKLT